MPDPARPDRAFASPKGTRSHETDRPSSKPSSWLKRWALYAAVALLLLTATGYFLAPWLVPLPPTLAAARRPAAPPSASRITPTNSPAAAMVSPIVSQATVVPCAELPTSLIAATLAAQDPEFWNHGGTDAGRVLRAMGEGVVNGRFVSGGSTITEQLAKLAAERTGRRSLHTRLADALLARRLEMSWSKEQILEEYMARLPFGNGHTGVAAAAAGYFGKPPAELRLAESAFLAGLPDAPTRFDPYRHFEEAKKRQEWVLERMAAAGQITTDEAQHAIRETLRLR
jgi:penicillin-binding protein 1C